MHSLRTRITMLTVWITVIAVTIVTLVSVLFIRSNKRRESEQLLLLLCETGQRNLDYYFDSVQKSMRKVSNFLEEDLENMNALTDGQLTRHIHRARRYFEEMAYKTNGVLTFYYRIDPEASATVDGFWYTNLEGEGFEEHEVTDITLYDTQDTTKLVWFTVPKQEGRAIWLPPYITDNLDKRVISYNVPIYWEGRFLGVAGIEIDYSTMAEQVDSIRLYRNGYAFLSDDEGNLFYHPRIDITQLSEDEMPRAPEGLASESTFYRYTFDGAKKKAAWLPLCNEMRLNVSVTMNKRCSFFEAFRGTVHKGQFFIFHFHQLDRLISDRLCLRGNKCNRVAEIMRDHPDRDHGIPVMFNMTDFILTGNILCSPE